MILFSRETATLISSLFGYEGSKELRTFAKKMRLDRGALKDEGDPVDEHYLVPLSKHDGMKARGATIVTPEEFRDVQQAKRAKRSAPKVVKPPAAKVTAPDEVYHPPSFSNRRNDRRKDWRLAEAQS